MQNAPFPLPPARAPSGEPPIHEAPMWGARAMLAPLDAPARLAGRLGIAR